MDNFQMVFQLGLNNLSLEAAKIAFHRAERGEDANVEKIAENLYVKYRVAYKFFGEHFNQSSQEQ